MDSIVHQDYSKISHCLKIWWNFVGNQMSHNISPNMISFSAGFFMFLSGILALLSNSQWTLIFHSFAIFIFQTLDAVDGIQARKLGLSSKLGNYIDHATDIFMIQIMFQVLFKTLELNGIFLAMTTIFVNFNLYLFHWQTVHTRIIYFDNWFSITELQLLSIILHLITYCFPNIWQIKIIFIQTNQLLIMLLIFLNFYYSTLPLISRVVQKKSIYIIKTLNQLFIITLLLSLWIWKTNIDIFFSIICINIPYMLMTNKLIISYLKFDEIIFGISTSEIYHIVWMIIFAELILDWLIIVKIIGIVLIYIAIKEYNDNILAISNHLNIPIFKYKIKKSL
jgi:phosphatidylglycerophosphate synthase